jgi:putative hemolysin
MSDVVVELLVILVLALIQAVFVAAEIALITIRRSRVEQLIDEGQRGARLVRRLSEDLSRPLAVIQIAVTFVGFLSSAYAAVNLPPRLESLFANVPVLREVAGGTALVVETILLAAFFIVFGELIPKTLALSHTDRFALALAVPVELLGRILGPVVTVLSGLTRVIARALGATNSGQRTHISTEELKLIVERGGEEGVLEAEEEQMISAVIEMGERRLHEVMVPRTSMTALPVTAGLDEAIDMIIREGHSRIPVYEETIDQVCGILYAKDLLPFLKGEDRRPKLRTLLRAPLFVPESMSIDDLLHKLQGRKVHLAIVLDEYGGTAGMVTIEDLLEEIVGEIQDEYDKEEPMIERLSDDQSRVDGRASVDDLGEAMEMDLSTLEDAEEYDTVGGLVYHRIGGVPRPGDRVELAQQGLTLTVESTDGRRVGKVLAVRQRRENSGEEEGAGD